MPPKSYQRQLYLNIYLTKCKGKRCFFTFFFNCKSLILKELQTLHAAPAQLVQGERVIKKPNRTKRNRR